MAREKNCLLYAIEMQVKFQKAKEDAARQLSGTCAPKNPDRMYGTPSAEELT